MNDALGHFRALSLPALHRRESAVDRNAIRHAIGERQLPEIDPFPGEQGIALIDEIQYRADYRRDHNGAAMDTNVHSLNQIANARLGGTLGQRAAERLVSHHPIDQAR